MGIGRPTTYDAEMLKKTMEYIQTGWEEKGHAFPSVTGLCQYIHRSRSIVYDWAKDPEKSEFSDMLDIINERQELIAWAKGMKGDYSASLTKLLLAKHGYHERSELTGADGAPLTISDAQLDAKILALNNAIEQLKPRTED